MNYRQVDRIRRLIRERTREAGGSAFLWVDDTTDDVVALVEDLFVLIPIDNDFGDDDLDTTRAVVVWPQAGVDEIVHGPGPHDDYVGPFYWTPNPDDVYRFLYLGDRPTTWPARVRAVLELTREVVRRCR